MFFQVKEWLCLNCQMQRALGGMEPPEPLMMKPQPLLNKVSTPVAPQKEPPATQKEKETVIPAVDQKKAASTLQKEETTTLAAPQKETPLPASSKMGETPVRALKQDTPTPDSPQNKKYPTPPGVSVTDEVPTTALPVKKDISASALIKEEPTSASPLIKEVTGSPLTKGAPASPQNNKEHILPGSQNRKVSPTPGSTQDNYAGQSGLPLKKEAPFSTAVETKEVQLPAAVISNEAPVPDSLKTNEATTLGSAMKKERSSTEISIDNQKPAIVQKSMEPPATPTNKQNKVVQPLQQPEKKMPAAQPLAQVQPQEAPKPDPKITPPKQELGKPASSAPAQKALENQGTSEPQTPPQQPSQSSAIPSTQQPPKQESGGLFGFGGPKSQSTPSKPEESVSGKMFGFGSSIFSSASTLITSAVQDEPHTTLPASPMVSAPASPKMPPAKETKPPAVQNAEEKKAEQPQQAKVPTLLQANVDKPTSEPPKGAASSQPALKAGQSTCPLCKVDLNMGSKDPPNYNTCTECKNTVCNLCGFNPMPHETEVKEWLCLNCQMQRALGGMEPPGPPMIKSQPLPSKVSTPAASLKLTPAPAKPQKEEIPTPAAAQKEIPPPTVPQETLIPAGTPSTAAVKKEETPAPGSPQNKHAPPAVAAKDKQEPIIVQKPVEQTIPVTLIPSGAATPAQQPEKQTPPLQQPDAKPPPQLQHQQVPKIDPKTDPLKQEPGKPQQQLPKGGTSPAKAVSQPQAKPPKQSVGFFGFGGAKSQPSQSKPEESVSGKMFGFGSSIFSSASTLITSAVQDEPHTTLPASPMVSAPASPMMTPAKETKPHAVQNAEEKKAEQPQQAKVPTLLHAKVDQPPLEPPKGKASSQPALKAGQSTCPLCKVELNIDSKDPPNYNTCTECKNTVCNLCGFNPMPHETEEWLCLNCQTQRALSGQLGDMGMMAQPQLTMTGAQPTPQPVATSTRTEPLFPAATTTEAQAVPLISEPIPHTLTPSSVAEVPTNELPKPMPPKSEPPKTPVVAAPVVSVPMTEAMTAPAPLPTTVATAIAVTPATAKAQPAELPKPVEEKVEKPAEKDEKPLKQQNPVPVTVPERVTPQPVPTADTIKKEAAPLVEKVDDVLPEPQQILTEKETGEASICSTSSGSEPSPSPQVQRRRLSAIAVSTAASSSSEDYKADSPAVSPDSSVDEEEFIRRQIMGMTGEEEMFLSEEEKDEKESIEEETKEAEVDNESGKSKLLLKKGIMDNEDSPARRPSPGSEAKTTADRSELTTTVFKKDMALQRTKSTDDGDAEVESITESLEDKSKGEGSSSVQVSSFTPGTSPTSASSLEEDSDSSPSHKRSGEGKQHRKAKHRQAGQSLPTIEDSSEEEELREEEDHLREQEKQESDQQQGKRSSKKSKRDKDELQTQRKWDKPVTSPSNLSPIENASPTVEMRQAREMEVFHKSSGSDYSPSMESDSEAFHTEAKIAVPKGQKFSTAEPLKNAEDIYEEMLQKARSPKGETEPVPEIEPLYGGMAIEDYLYESLVEEPEAKPSSALPEQSSKDHAKEPGKKSLRSPEEVYEEIMLKKKELMLIEQEFQRAQSAMDTPTPEIHVTAPSSAAAESCKVGEAEGEKPMLDADSTYVKRKKRPAPPRPSEPPKRPEVYVAKPTVPQDMTMRRALFPIPDLKITQCSSGEDETDDSIIEEYGVGVSSDITPSDESETKEQVESSPVSEHTPIIEAAEIEPIIVVCEVPQAKATPAPLPADISPPSIAPIMPVSPTTVLVTIPDVVTDPTQAPTPATTTVHASAPLAQPQASVPASVVVHIPDPVVIQMPDLVTSPSQMSVQGPPSVQVTAPTPVPSPVPSEATSPVPAAPSAMSTSATVSAPTPAPAPVVVQMPDLVTITSSVSPQAPLPVTSSAPAQATVVHSVPVQTATVTTSDPSPVHKAPAPPPVPPKPVSIPAGLVFSHRPGESVKPPVYPTASHTLPTTREVVPKASSAEPFTATTLPRTREPPNALSLSLTTPVESKMSATSPRSPLSPRNAKCLETYVVITLPSEPGTPTEGITVQAPIRRGSILPSKQTGPGVRTTPSEQQSPIEAFSGVTVLATVVSSLSHVYSSSISTSAQPPERLPSLVTQVVTTEVQRTTVSVVHERLPQAPASDALAILIQPDLAKVQPSPKQNGKIYSGDAIDLRTIKVGVKMTDSGMDLTPQESSRQSVCSNSSGRHTAVQPEIVNLSAEITPSATLAVVTDSITIVTCSATIASYTSEPEEKPLDLQGYVASMPLPLTTYKPFEPLAQIVYRRVDSPPIVSTVIARDTETPINLSYGASTVDSRLPVTMAPAVSNGGTMLSELAGAVDLSTSRPLRAMVALSGTSPGVVTTVVEDDGTPIDLTAGKNVCCDVIYKLPFTGSCRTQPPVITQPDHFSYRDDHYQYDHAGVYGIKVLNGKAMSETNLADAGLFLYNGKTEYDYNGVLDSAVDLTAGNISAGEALDYTSKAAGAYTGISTAPYSQVPAYSVFRSSDGMVYSSIAAPVPSTYAITTQPGSIFSTTLPPTTTLQEQPAQAPYPYGFIPTTDPGNQIISLGTGLPKDLLPSALADIMTGFPALYSDQTLEAIAASLEALASLPMFPGLDDSKITQYQMEREFLQLEKLKQLCLAEELEWERQEIQRYREQEQIMVQRELEELQALKQKLLVQQEEEHQAHLVAQQETYNQQREQLEQIQQLQVQLQHQLEEHYGTTGTSDNLLEAQYAGVGDNGQYWPVRDESTTSSTVIQLEGGVQYVTGEGQREVGGQDQLQFSRKQSAGSKQPGDQGYGTGVVGKRIVDSGVQTDDEDSVDRTYVGRRKRNNRGRGVDSSVQTDDEEDQEDGWDMPTRSRRRSRSSKHSGEGKHSGSKVSSIAIQTVAEISVQTDHSGSIKCPSIQMDTKVEIIKHISAPENSQRGGSLSCQTDTDRRRHLPVEVGYSAYLKADLAPKSPKVLYSPVSPLSPSKAMEEGQKRLTTDPSRFSNGPRMLKPGPKSLPDPKSLSPTTEDRIGYHHTETYSGSPSGTGKKVKRTLPNPPPEDDPLTGPSGYSANSARRRLGRHTTMARAKILQDIDKELDLVERESSKLRRKQAELDEEEKEIDAKLRYLEMGINRRKDALLQEREKRERAYLQGVAEERDYMSDSEVSNIRETRGNSHGLERPRTAPQSEFDQFIPPETEADSQYPTLTSPYSHYTQYVPQTQAISHYPQQTLYQQQALYQQHPYQSQSVYSSVPSLSYPQASHSHQQAQSSGYQSKNTTNYEVIRNQPMIIVPSSSEGGYGVGKYGSLELRMGLEERSMASSPMSSISAESFYADIDHHNARNYVLIEDIEQLTKGSTALGSAGLGSGFSLPDKDLSKADRLLRAAEARRTAEVAEFLGNSRLHSYGKGEEDSMEEPYELKLLKQQIKQEFRRGTEGLEHLSGLGMPQYLPTDPSYRHFPKADKYSISRLTLEKQAAKQLPAAVLYQKQIKNQKKATLMDPKITKFSSIQESRDLEPDYSSFLGSGASSVTNLSTRARLLQDEITFGLRKNLSEQQKYLDSSLGSNLSLGLGGPTMRTTLQDDTTYPSGTRSRPSSRPNSRPTSVYGLDLSIKRDLSSSSLRLKIEGEALDAAFGTGVTRTKPTSLPISQSRGRIPIVAQNSEEESPLSPVGEPMGMARASAGPLPPISADSRDQFGSSHSLPEVQQHMREESRATLGHSGVYDRDIAFIMDDLGGAMSDSEAYHLRREDTDWFDKPAERQHQENGQPLDRRQVRGIKLIPYVFPHTRLKLQRDPKDTSVSGNGLGIRVVGGKEIPGCHGEIGAYIAKVTPGGVAEQTGKVVEGMQVLELNGVPLMGKTYEEVQCIMGQPSTETELCVRLDLNMLSDPEHPQALENHDQLKPGDRQCSPGVDPKQLAAELQKFSQQQAPGMGVGMGVGGSSAVPSPGQPASPAINKKQRHNSQPHPITGEIQLQINYDRNLGNLIVHVLQARNLAQRDPNRYSDPFVKVYLLPGRGQVMVVQNASGENKRRTKYVQRSLNPEWNQTVIYKNIHLEQLKKKTLEVTVWDYDKSSSNDFLGEVLIDLSNTTQLDNTPRWLPLKEQSESIEHSRSHHTCLESPKNSVIKSRSHGIFPDPAKDMQMVTLEKSHSSPGSSKSSSEGQLRSHGPSRSQSKSSVTQAHLEDAGIAIAAAEAAVQQARLQPRPGHRLGDVSGPVVSSAPNLLEGYGGLDGEEGAGTGVDRGGGKTQMMGEIKVALKKEVKQEGDQLVLEVLQCRNITYKFKSPDHLPDLYVKLYVVNVATQKRIIKKKTRVCRHDREPSFNETFRFSLNPTGHSLQLFLVSNGGKFMKKTLIGEAYIWLDKVDMRKRVVSWHKLLVNSTHNQS
uniref:Protein piccolo n=1 Tax=Oncorhynchus mykiss TaxID=8022 RepID=A0A8K9WRD2_ONCMY